MKSLFKTTQLAGAFAIVLGVAAPTVLAATPAAAHEMDRGYHDRDGRHDGGRGDRDGGRHFDRHDRNNGHGHWGWRHNRREWIDDFWSGR